MAKKYNVSIIPIDSEHSAIYQLLIKNGKKDLKKIIITASGGSFRNKNINELKNVTVKDALNHPNWQMGNKITIDSCTMMNKAFEIIEAHHLFEFQYEKIETLIHLESIIHSMVVFNDNSVFAQMGVSDMKIPINFALNTPNHNDCDVKELDFVQCGKLSFEKLSFEKYPCFKLAMEVVKKGGLYYTVLNAANEVAVKLFLDGKIKYLEIANIIENEINEYKNDLEYNLENILIVDTFVKNKLIKKYYEGEIKC